MDEFDVDNLTFAGITGDQLLALTAVTKPRAMPNRHR